MEAKHTSGQWLISSDFSFVYAFDPSGQNDIVARVDFAPNAYARRANARLIAYAPELLEMLQALAAQHKCGCGHPACTSCERGREAFDLIERATGYQS